jgi:hypothetical protein
MFKTNNWIYLLAPKWQRSCTIVIYEPPVGEAVPNQDSILTFDEQKAAEAAFRGLPADPIWSSSAHAIYDGILAHTQGRNILEESGLVATLL